METNFLEISKSFKTKEIEIRIKVAENQQNIKKLSDALEIIDKGIGISEDAMVRIFEKFYQEDKSHNGRGNGLGLALVKTILDLYNADIRVESKIDEGSTFTVELPLQSK